MAKSHPATEHHGAPRFAQWTRNTVASLALLACLVSLSIILNHDSARLVAAFAHRISAIDLTRLMPLAEPQPLAADPSAAEHRAVGEFLARRYRVSSEVATNIVAKAHAAGAEFKLDPMLILAVISVESRFNPIAESTMGAKGLMQIIPRYHAEKFNPLGGEKVAFDPEANIIVGSRILKEYIRLAGDLGGALQMYVGATSEESENGYSGKVLAERDRLHYVLRQYRNQNRAVREQSPKPRLASAT